MRIETKRLILRFPKKGDEKHLVKHLNNINISKNMSNIPHPYTSKQAKEFIIKSLKEMKERKIKSYKIFLELKSNNEVIGGIGLGKLDYTNKSGEIGYWLSEEYWKQGLMSEAMNQILRWAFGVTKLRRIELYAYPENKTSNIVAKKFHFKLEGRKRKAAINKTTKKLHDLNMYSLLKNEWRIK